MQSFLDNTRTDGPCLYVIFKLISLYILSNLSTEKEIFAGLFLRIKKIFFLFLVILIQKP